MSTVTERVERGAALLDERLPGWWREIDLETLNIKSRCGCVLGQVARSPLGYPHGNLAFAYVDGLEMLGLRGWEARDRGFDHDVEIDEDDSSTEGERAIDAEYSTLTAAWRELIISRRAAAEVAA